MRARLSRRPRRGTTYVDVNRSLRPELAGLLGSLDWDVALLQEAPPRWFDALMAATGSAGERVLTSRNSLPALRAAIAERNPDLIASNEGGSNVLLVRFPWRIAATARERLACLPERRMLLMARIGLPSGERLVVANTHLSVPATGRGESEVLHAAAVASEWAAGDPLVLGGDLNLRPADAPAAFDALESRFGLVGPTGPRSLDHLLVAGLDTLARPAAMPTGARELAEEPGLAIRLSDHAPVTAAFRLR